MRAVHIQTPEGFGTGAARPRILRRAVALLLIATAMSLAASPAGAVTKTFTLDAHFDEGSLLNVNHDSPNNDQLQLNTISEPLPLVYIACSGRGTLVRIDVNTGAILGEYFTSPNGMGRDPSRTTVDKLGNCWVSNRAEDGISGGQRKGSVTRIGVILGGTRCNSDGTPNPTGQYLKPPFVYSTVADRDGDGLIKTSLGLGDILPWTNAGAADTHGGVSTAEDEAIINYTRIVGTAARTVAVDANNDIWTGGLGDLDHEKVSGVTGLPVPGTQFNLGCGGYGGLIDANNVLWSARGGSGLLRFDTNTMTGSCAIGYGCGDYGLGIDPATGNIWHTTLSNARVYVISPTGVCLGNYPHGDLNAQGVAVDGVGNVWVAHSLFGTTTVGHLRTDGTFVGNVNLPGGNGPTGVAVDANGKVWVANINSNNAMRIDPAAGAVGGGGFTIGAVDLTVDLGAGAGAYNYSDMTGFVSLSGPSGSGTWTVAHDGGEADFIWSDVSWTSSEPAGTSVTVEVRSANSQVDLASQPFAATTNGGALSITGRYIEIHTTLTRGGPGTPSPILYDLTVNGRPPNTPPNCDNAVACDDVLWPPDHGYRPISICGVTDADGDPVTITVTSIRQDEPINTRGDGNTCPDGQIVDGQAVVRAERSGTPATPGNGRVYTIGFTASDGKGGECNATVTVCVPRDQSRLVCENDGPAYNSLTSCAGTVALPPDVVSFNVTRTTPASTTLVFALPADGMVNLAIFDVAGRKLVTIENSLLSQGTHERVWDTSNLANGMYFARLQAGGKTITSRFLKND